MAAGIASFRPKRHLYHWGQKDDLPAFFPDESFWVIACVFVYERLGELVLNYSYLARSTFKLPKSSANALGSVFVSAGKFSAGTQQEW